MTKPSKPSVIHDAKIEAVLAHLHGAADRQFSALLLHYLSKLPGLFLGNGIQWDEPKTAFCRDKYSLIERDQGELLYLLARSLLSDRAFAALLRVLLRWLEFRHPFRYDADY